MVAAAAVAAWLERSFAAEKIELVKRRFVDFEKVIVGLDPIQMTLSMEICYLNQCWVLLRSMKTTFAVLDLALMRLADWYTAAGERKVLHQWKHDSRLLEKGTALAIYPRVADLLDETLMPVVAVCWKQSVDYPKEKASEKGCQTLPWRQEK